MQSGNGTEFGLWLASVIAFAFAMSCTPGPNNTLLFRSGMRFGLRRTIPHMIGISIGFPLLFLIVAFGAGSVLRTYPVIFTIMRWIGIAYLLWLAWHIASEHVTIEQGEVSGSGQPMTFIQALFFQWVNPKAWIIASGTLFTYTHPNANQWREIVVLTLVFLCVNPISCILWSWLGLKSARLVQSARGAFALQYGMAGLLVVSIVPLILEQFAK